MLFYNARPCYPGGLVDSVTDSVNKFCFIIDDFLDEPRYVIIDISNRLFMVDPIFVLYGFRC